MAQKYLVQLVDDLSNEPIEAGEGETISFAVDGVSYAIDLSTTNAESFRSVLSSYVAAARKADGAAKARPGTSRPSGKADLKAVREWAASNGYTVSSRGRIPAQIQEAYALAH